MEDKELNEHINKIKKRFGYQINETPKYRQVIDDSIEFDEVPVDNIHSTEDGFPTPIAGGGTDAYLEEQEDEEEEVQDTEVREPSNVPFSNQEDVPEPEEETEVTDSEEEVVNDVPEPEGESVVSDKTETEDDVQQNTNPEKEVNQIQNDIIKHNIEAMKSLQDKINDLENINTKLSSQLSHLNTEVEEVKEPTDAEKLMSKKDVSYPFYFNLNDFWGGNWFEKQREEANEKGIRQLEDGTYVADFDDLPTHNTMDIEDSFNSIV